MRKPNEVHPLAGTRILVGRARHQANSLSAGLRSLGASVVEIPFIEIRKPQSHRPLDEALKSLARIDERKSQIVELRFFGGLSVEETAEVMKVAPITIMREWNKAKAWLYRELASN